MKLVIQRVIESNLSIDKIIYSSIGYGMVIFIGISVDDNESFLNNTASKVSKLRIFNDEFGKMNKNINSFFWVKKVLFWCVLVCFYSFLH